MIAMYRSRIVAYVSLCVVLVWAAASIAGEPMSDDELAALYGGWRFYNRYCGSGGSSCPEQVGCTEDIDEFTLCQVCVPTLGKICVNYWSSIPDFDGCHSGTTACANSGKTPEGDRIMDSKGWCNYAVCVRYEFGTAPPGTYPSCTVRSRSTCQD